MCVAGFDCCPSYSEGCSKIKFAEKSEVLVDECVDYDKLNVNSEECEDELTNDGDSGCDGPADADETELQCQDDSAPVTEDTAAQWSESNLPECSPGSEGVSSGTIAKDTEFNNMSKGTLPFPQDILMSVAASRNVPNGVAAFQENYLRGILHVRSFSTLPKLGNAELSTKLTDSSRMTQRTKIKTSQRMQHELCLMRDTNQNVCVKGSMNSTKNSRKLLPNSSFKTTAHQTEQVENHADSLCLGNFGMAPSVSSKQTHDHQSLRMNSTPVRKQILKAKTRLGRHGLLRRIQEPVEEPLEDPSNDLAMQSTFSPIKKEYSALGPSISMRVMTPYDPNLHLSIHSKLGGQNENSQAVSPATAFQAITNNTAPKTDNRQGKPKKRNYNEAYGRPSPVRCR